jgi:pimeloyl-ACP methyl ester carboxylesterase
LPALVISGSQDLLVPSSSARKLADLCRAEYLKFADCGHTVPAEAGERFNRELSRFLTNIAGRNEP